MAGGRAPRFLVVLALASMVGGCMVREIAHQPFPAGTVSFHDWETFRSPHFVVHTDVGPGAAEAILSRFEDTYQALSNTYFRHVQVSDVEAMVFAEGAEYDGVAVRGTGGIFVSGLGSTGGLLLVRFSADPAGRDLIVAHELVHRFADVAYPNLPPWMDEGLAKFLETVQVRDDEIVLGQSPRRASIHPFAETGGVSFRTLVTAPSNVFFGPEASFYYTAAWGTVYHLMTGDGGKYRRRFPDLLVALEQAQQQGQTAESAFTTVYPEVPLATMDEAVEHLTRRLSRPGIERLLVLPLRRPRAPITRHLAEPEELDALLEGVRARSRPATVQPPAPVR